MWRFEYCIGNTLKWEGGYSNDTADRGGETYCGISRKYNPDWAGWKVIDAYKRVHGLERGEVVAGNKLLNECVTDYYKAQYWNSINAEALLGEYFLPLLFDWYVHSGAVATKALQALVGVKPDGNIGPKTIAAINAVDDKLLFTQLKERRIMFLKAIVQRDPTQGKYINGWLRRVNSFT